MPTLLNQTFPIEPFNDDDDDNDSRSVLQTSIAKPEDENDKIHQRLLVLEAEVEKSNKAATETLQELSKERMRCSDLENRIEELKLALEWERKKNLKVQVDQNDAAAVAKPILDDECYERMLEIARQERDDALDLVREIRKLMI